jgi:aspartate aminotransferase
MLILNSPSNPTGSVMHRNTLKGIADLCVDKNIRVMSDEIYEHIIYEGEHVSIGSFDGMFERTLTLSGLSKTYAMTGWRLGWLVAPEKDITAVNKLQTHSVTCCTSFTQPAAVEALKGTQEPRIAMVKEFKKRRDLALDLLTEIKGIECNRPEGAFYLFPKYAQKMTSDEMAMYLMKDAHVAVTPGRSFGPAGEGFFRLSYATSEDNIIKGIESIKRSLSKI